MKTIKYFLLLMLITMAFVKGVPRWKTGVALYSFHHHAFKKSLDMAQRCGLTNVEGFSFQKLGEDFGDKTMGDLNATEVTLVKQMLAERNLNMSSLFVGKANGLNDWEKYFKLGQEFGVKYLVCEPLKKDWGIIDSLAGVYKTKIAIHEHKKPNLYWHPDSVLAAVKGHKNIGACADIGHWVRSGLDPVNCLKALSGHIIGIHLKDVDKSGKDVDPGKGEIDFARVVQELKRQKFTGYINVECEHNWEDNTTDVKNAIQYIQDTAKNEK
ncbi:sugar phosphate isomerase/epimerase family protein [Spirosoma endbachense]|uniref:TIM barrel protein n=1 Tax=Spirosoma endbachense TaxID=2666025 RepID=A0A6P1VYK5_9BACT|nr:sugar phosphate isomerase/epimerase [Spirosoma endbachense]QHV97398.1 TIM barrel protein [Spirosoma endbachense]